jgi:hypothetical protein
LSPLLSLPAEIRIQIFEMAMEISTDLPRLYADGPYPLWDRLSVSHTSRQIFAETAQRYFDTYLVFFATALDLGIFLDYEVQIFAHHLLTPSQKRSVQHISIRGDMPWCDSKGIRVDVSVLREFSGLRKITFWRGVKVPPGCIDELYALLRWECVRGRDLEIVLKL